MVAPLRRRRAHAHAGMHAAHTYAYTCMHCYVHPYARTHVTSGAHLVRAHAPQRVGASAGLASAAAGHSQVLQVGPVGRRRQRRELGVARGPARLRAAAPGGSGPRLTRAGRPRAPAMRARARRGRGRRIQRRVARPSAARGTPSQQRNAGTAANAQGGRATGRDAQVLQELALAERLRERLHLRGVDEPAVRPCKMGRRGLVRAEATESRHACTHTHPHAPDRHTER